jgi:hypothetical protein
MPPLLMYQRYASFSLLIYVWGKYCELALLARRSTMLVAMSGGCAAQAVKCSAEIGAWGSEARPTMLSFSSMLGFLHRAP